MIRFAHLAPSLFTVALFSCARNPEPQPADIAERPLAGQVVCETSYKITGRDQFTPDQFDAIGDAVLARGGEFMKQLDREQTDGNLPAAVSLSYDRTHVSVVFTGACDAASGAQSHFLEFMHAETAPQELPQVVRLELAAMTQQTAPGTGAQPVGTQQ